MLGYKPVGQIIVDFVPPQHARIEDYIIAASGNMLIKIVLYNKTKVQNLITQLRIVFKRLCDGCCF